MRKLSRFKPLWTVVAAAALGQTASAQGPGAMLDGPFPPAGPQGYAAPPGYGGPQGYAAPPGYGGPQGYPGQAYAPGPQGPAGAPTYTPVGPDPGSPAGLPPGANPYPAVSPYENGWESTYNDKGIWFRERRAKNRKYSFNMEYIYGNFKQPGNVPIGSNIDLTPRGGLGTVNFPARDFQILRGSYIDAPPSTVTINPLVIASDTGRYFVDGAGGGGGGGGTTTFTNGNITLNFDPTGDFSATAVDQTYPYPVTGFLTGVDADADGALADDETSTTPFYGARGDVFSDDDNGLPYNVYGGVTAFVGQELDKHGAPGLRLGFGLEDEDGTGFEMNGWYLSAQPSVFRRGLDDPTYPVVTNALVLFSPDSSTPLGLNEPGGNPVPANDTAFRQARTPLIPVVQVLTFNQVYELKFRSEVASTDMNFVRTPLIETDWLKLNPILGARYTYIGEQFDFLGRDNGNQVQYDATGVAVAEARTITSVNVADPTFQLNTPITFGFASETTLRANVKTHLYGPQAGVNYAFGGEHIMINGSTKFSLAANTEQIRIDSAGMGINERLFGDRIATTDQQTSTHVSPVFEFAVNADLNLFPLVPVVNRWSFFKNARVRTGWSTLVVGEVARPLQSINWQDDYSGGPNVQVDRSTFFTNYYNIGVNWTF